LIDANRAAPYLDEVPGHRQSLRPSPGGVIIYQARFYQQDLSVIAMDADLVAIHGALIRDFTAGIAGSCDGYMSVPVGMS
jgi:hypothetical protein